jgi:hypothetical protein
MKPASNKNKPEAAPAMAARAATIARDTVPLLARQISTVRLAGGVFWKRRTPTGTVCTISATKTPTESRMTRRSCRGGGHGRIRRGPAGPRGFVALLRHFKWCVVCVQEDWFTDGRRVHDNITNMAAVEVLLDIDRKKKKAKKIKLITETQVF